ncbi:hypothetical protein SLEP1_g54746 [Rubroshorea leprosula]|uniref:Uncharacterized protein n=1 Tax=Rubroshorea leprosula TaxID=152421 RepID=A0AAV5MEH2_9ROSI|nr:hypothetical protein SLEP1_g54746 [Rubroshorea leprosula]
MDPSIVKLFEEDEDESMHSGADVDALQAALNRHIEGDTPPSQPSDSETGSVVAWENALQLFLVHLMMGSTSRDKPPHTCLKVWT